MKQPIKQGENLRAIHDRTRGNVDVKQPARFRVNEDGSVELASEQERDAPAAAS